jgi:hypothetical protein
VLPGEITSDPGVRYLQMQMQMQIHGQVSPVPKLPRLNLSTGTVTYLPAAHFEQSPLLFW